MGGIIVEGVLFVAIIATAAALLVRLVTHFSPLGTRLRQNENRRRIERDAELACPFHGAQREDELVRLPSGSRLCPQCYKEALHGEFRE